MKKDPAKIQRMFGDISLWYDAINHFGSAAQDLIWRKMLLAKVMVRREGRPVTRALDLCCGTGDVTFLLAQHATSDLMKRGWAEPYGGTGNEHDGRDRQDGRYGQDNIESTKSIESIPPTASIHPRQAFPVPEMRLAAADEAARPEIIGLDFTPELLAIAERRAAAFGRAHPVTPRFMQGDALRVPFPDGSFDAVTIAFGLRNLADFEGGLREMARLLRPGGVLGILEFGHIPNPVIRQIYMIYFAHVMPAAGRLLTGTNAYGYLRDSCLAFPPRQEVAAAIHWTGLKQVDVRTLTFGIADIYTAVKE